MSLKKAATAAAATLVLAGSASAEMIEKISPHSVAVTIDRLEAAVTGAGATVFARVDHAKGASSVDAELRPTQMLMFGNPKLGTPLMQINQTAGLDLPLRVVSFEAEDGSVHVVYHSPTSIAAAHAVPSDTPVLAKIAGALDALTDKAIAPE